ncbi:ribonucleases P/MRP protein subunit POP1 [Drosophila novamexicana]|uniref:ribonucleases P/MRP protein subunit POP1 n=1 Tax=Drosophila novamexicana TaxID=47314 RepID=UPI0011E59A1F|nr:ribonucleases P/MRP protein subunit POP1 [Drosophila novamexicana]
MSSHKLEYDASLGGGVALPSNLPTYHYASGALNEIKTMIAEASQKPVSSKLIFQSLPKHMRRRAMSHHPNRLPRKYRSAHKCQMAKAGNQPVAPKRPSRKYRRRAKNLLREYLRRQRNHIWLETHIWHAKRFHMIDRWGYRLAYASCDKTYRACYRASSEHCLVQDISFYSCVQLEGSLDRLRMGFGRLTSPECGLGIAAKTYISGRREGSIQLFADSKYPSGALQRVLFMWRPEKQTENQPRRTLWLWLHPAGAEATIAQLIKVFQLKSTKQERLPLPYDSDALVPSDKLNKVPLPVESVEHQAEGSNKQPLRFWTYTKAFERNRSYANADTGLRMAHIKHEFNRFRLTGPRAQRVLAASLRAYRQGREDSPRDDLRLGDTPGQALEPADFCEAALQLSSPSELLSNLIISVNVVDPRLQRPSKRSKAAKPATSLVNAAQLQLSQPKEPPHSDLWDSEFRERLSKTMMPQHKYNQLRSLHAIVPGQRCDFEDQLQPLPLLLIQRPGSQQAQYKRLGYAAGWDVIVPARYGMVLWQTLIMWGARPGGLREFDSVARESGIDHYLPDTVAGQQQTSQTAKERRAQYFRQPPNKRCNYRRLSVVSPFVAPWHSLVRDWSVEHYKDTHGYFVLRNRELLQCLDDCVRRRQEFPETISELCLIQIEVRMHARGKLKDNALICQPTPSDWVRRRQQQKHDEHEPVHTEPLQSDLNERLRKQLRHQHKRLLKRLRSRRVREKRKLQETSTKRVHIRPARTGPLICEQFAKMCDLWLPSDPTKKHDSVRRQCSREVLGYVTCAGFSFVEAAVCGVGYITARGLRQLLQVRQPGVPLLCLVRNEDSRDYRFARVQINVNVSAGA